MALTAQGVRNVAQDIVAILDADNYQQLFDGSHIMKVTVKEFSKITSWPIEDGAQRSDHRFVLPVEMEIPMLLTDDTRALFEQMRQAYLDCRTLIVQTRVRSYENMVITEFPHDESAEQGESIPMAIRLEEVRTVAPTYGDLPQSKVANKSQSSTVKKGTQQTSEPDATTRRKASVLYGIFN